MSTEPSQSMSPTAKRVKRASNSTSDPTCSSEAIPFLAILRCPVCQLLPRAEVFLCINGHSFCNKCYEKRTGSCPFGGCSFPEIGIRNHLVEQQLDISGHQFPCSNEDIGCYEKLPRTKINLHEDNCRMKAIPCLMKECETRCSRLTINLHMVQHHSSYTLRGPKTFFWVDRDILGHHAAPTTCIPRMHMVGVRYFFSTVVYLQDSVMIFAKVDTKHPDLKEARVLITVEGFHGAVLSWAGSPYDLEDSLEHMVEKQAGLCISNRQLKTVVRGAGGFRNGKDYKDFVEYSLRFE